MKTIKWYVLAGVVASLLSGQRIAAMEDSSGDASARGCNLDLNPRCYAGRKEGDGAERFLDVVQRISPIHDMHRERDEVYDEAAVHVGATKARKQGEKRKGPHRCEECGDGLSSQAALKRHKIIHTGEKKHTCKKCNTMFSRADGLQDHISRCHKKEMRYACREQCNRRFKGRDDRYFHEMKCGDPVVAQSKQKAPVFQDRRQQHAAGFDCHVCDISLPTKKGLDAHNRINHKKADDGGKRA